MRMSFLRTSVTAMFLACAATAAFSQEEPFGQPLGGWTFNQAPKGSNVACNAVLKQGKISHVLGGVTHESYYVSVNAGTVKKGTYRGATLTLSDGERNVTVKSDGGRMWFDLADFDLDKLAQDGGYVLTVPLPNGNFGGGEYNLNNAPEALGRMFECLQANGG